MIRKVKPTDASAIVAIYNEYIVGSVISFETESLTEEAMRRRIEDIADRFPYLVWEENGEIAGYCYAHPWKERAAYGLTLETTIYLAPQYKRRGIGLRLMTALIDECRAAGFRTLIACITGGNEDSIALHRRLGFRQVSCFEKVGMKFGRELDVIDMELLLS